MGRHVDAAEPAAHRLARLEPYHGTLAHIAGGLLRHNSVYVAADACALAASGSCPLSRPVDRRQFANCRARLFSAGCNKSSLSLGLSQYARKARHTGAASNSRQVAMRAVPRPCASAPTWPIGTRGGIHGVPLSNRLRSRSSNAVSAHSRWRASISDQHVRHRYHREQRRRHETPLLAPQGPQRPGRVRPQT